MKPACGAPVYDAGCRRCPRLATFLDAVSARNPGYFCRPVPPFGDPRAALLLVGLAPGMHGANRTGRPFTGDYAGVLLYRTLYDFGFATMPESVSADDPLELRGARITNSVKCLPPENKPLPSEIANCSAYLRAELAALPPRVILALGRVGHDAALRALSLKPSAFPFAHGARHEIGAALGPGVGPPRRDGDPASARDAGPARACEAGQALTGEAGQALTGEVGQALTMFDSYHCSRYNTQTRRLTDEMFREVFARIVEVLGGEARPRAQWNASPSSIRAS
jgi:uracil-DNA glycosylase family 4